MRRRVFLQLAGAGIWNGAAAGSAAGGPLPIGAIRLAGYYGYRPHQLRDLPPGTVIDARGANFTVANSRNGAPVPDMTCEVGQLPTNPYPVVLRNCPGVRFVGGRFDGEVPMTSGWRETYCNSAALLLRDGSSTPLVEEIRVRRAWDGVRFAEGCDDFTLRSSWLSDIRDDAVENDHLKSGTIEDCLFDGCFSGISIDPGGRSGTGADRSLAVHRCLIRMQPFPDRARHQPRLTFQDKRVFAPVEGDRYSHCPVVAKHAVSPAGAYMGKTRRKPQQPVALAPGGGASRGFSQAAPRISDPNREGSAGSLAAAPPRMDRQTPTSGTFFRRFNAVRRSPSRTRVVSSFFCKMVRSWPPGLAGACVALHHASARARQPPSGGHF